jgi:C4-dicarboxylate-specific signal transduction histidine kinase
MVDEAGNAHEYVGTIIDTTERVRAEEALRKSQEELARVTRVLSMGAVTASIGHELNQFVLAIVTNGSAALRWIQRAQPNLEETVAAVRRMIRDAELASDIIGNIRAFLQKTAVSKEPLDVAEVIMEVRAVVGGEVAKQRVTIEESYAPALPRILGVRIELEQVLLNLVLNGIEAMADVVDRPRILTIRCEPSCDIDSGTAVAIAVEDAGRGFDGVNPEELFEAFYTTKPDGLGMGLSIARSIVQAHGGRLTATANAEHGATFQFFVPGVEE